MSTLTFCAPETSQRETGTGEDHRTPSLEKDSYTGSVSATPPCQATCIVPVVASIAPEKRQQRTPSAYPPPRLVTSVSLDQVCPPSVEVTASMGAVASIGAAA